MAEGGRLTRRELGVWVGLMVVLAGAFARAVCPAEPFPWWEADAFSFAPPIGGLTPTPALVLDLLIMGGAALTLACARGGPGRVGSVLLACGLGAVGFHAARDVETVSAGADLAAGMAALAGAWAASATPGARRVMVGVALGLGVMLAAGGANELLVEHPATVASFERTRGVFYQAKGWDPDGPEAAMYEERLSHADPTGAFGLTNVLATFAGASAVGLIAAAMGGRGARWTQLLLVGGAVASAWVLVTTGSKGAIGSAALAALVVAVFWARGPAWVGRAVLATAALVVLAVTARGLVGERVGEKSLLFRSQYQRGTLAVWREHPLVGVGPGQFQDSYARLKPPAAPEDVTSPHSVGLDWVGLLGVGGLAWVGLLGAGWWRRGEPGAGDEQAAVSARVLVRLAGVVVGVGVLAAAWVERQTMVAEGAAALLVGGVGWALVAGVIAGWGGQARGAALAGAAVALVHGQLDVTAAWAVSAPAWGVLVGCGIGALAGRDPGVWARWVSAGAVVLTGGVLGSRLGTVAAWEAGLDRAAQWPAMIGAARIGLAVAEESGDPVQMSRVADEVSGWVGGRVPTDAGAIGDALSFAVLRAQKPAAEGLEAALRARPGHTGTREALGRVLVTMAVRDAQRDPAASRAAWDRAQASAEAGTRLRAGDPDAWNWLGTVYEQRSLAAGADRAAWLGRAVEAWVAGDRLTPNSPASAARVAVALADLGRAGEARAWAREALARDDRLALDPRRRLSEARRARVGTLTGAAPGGDAGGGGGVEGGGTEGDRP